MDGFNETFQIILFLLLDMAAIPDFVAGAMENWGLVLYRETVMLYDPKANSVSNKNSVADVIAHELAHQLSHKN